MPASPFCLFAINPRKVLLAGRGRRAALRDQLEGTDGVRASALARQAQTGSNVGTHARREACATSSPLSGDNDLMAIGIGHALSGLVKKLTPRGDDQ